MIASQNKNPDRESTADLSSIHTIEKAHIIICACMMAAGLFWWPTPQVLMGLAGGCIISFLNFRFIRSIVGKITTSGDKRHGARFMVKLLLMMILLGLLIFVLKVDTLAFLIGFSSMVLGIFFEAICSLFSPKKEN